MDYYFGPATESDIDQICALIDQRLRWMDEAGIRQWNTIGYWDIYPKEHYMELLQAGNLYVLRCTADGLIVAVAAAYDSDPRWPDGMDGSAYYIHHFATDTHSKGAGAILLEYLEALSRQRGKSAIRLDCNADNPRLNQYYEEKGYVYAGTCVDGAYEGNRREKRFPANKEDSACSEK